MAFSLIWRRRGYGAVSNLIYGGSCVSRSFSSVGSVSTDRRMSPWLMLPPRREGEDVVYKFFSLAENRVLSFNWRIERTRGRCLGFDPDNLLATLVGSSHGWLGSGTFDQIGLINPLTRRHVKLPSHDIPESYAPCGLPDQIIMSCPPDEDEGECRVLMAYGERHLAFCCPGRSPRWTRIGDDGYYDSFVYSKRQKLFFCARRSSEQSVYLEAWDLRDPLYPKLTLNDPHLSLEKDDCRPRSDFLVINEDTDDLFLVRRFVWLGVRDDDDGCSSTRTRTIYYHDDIPYKTVAFNVYRYDPESRSMRYMDGGSLDGLSFFIGGNSGFALCAAEFPELKPNSIYFTDVFRPPWSGAKFGGHDIGIFNYQDATISPCYYPCNLTSCKMLSPHPHSREMLSPHLHSRKMLSPHPRWFTPNTTTKAN